MTTDLREYAEAHKSPPKCWVCRSVPLEARLAIESAAKEGVVSRPAMVAWLQDPEEWNLPDATIHKVKEHLLRCVRKNGTEVSGKAKAAA